MAFPEKAYADLLAETDLEPISLDEEDGYYGSTEPNGPRRLVDIVRESAWWSGHLAGMASLLYGAAGGLLVLAGSLALIAAVGFGDFKAISGATIARVVSAAFGIAVTGGLFRISAGFKAFSEISHKVDQSGTSLLGGTFDIREALELAVTYQCARLVSPPIPSWIYEIRKDYLNRL